MMEQLIRAILKQGAAAAGERVVSLALLEAAWPWLVGHDMAQRTRPREWRQRTLYIEASSYAWVQELSFHREELMARIQRLFPWPLERLHLSVATHFTPLSVRDDEPVVAGLRPARARDRPGPAVDAQQVSDDLERLDDETRALLVSIGKHLKREG